MHIHIHACIDIYEYLDERETSVWNTRMEKMDKIEVGGLLSFFFFMVSKNFIVKTTNLGGKCDWNGE